MTGIYRGVKSTQVFDSLDAARSAIPASAAASIEVWEFGQTIEFVRDPDGADLTMYDGSRWRREVTPAEAVDAAARANASAADASAKADAAGQAVTDAQTAAANANAAAASAAAQAAVISPGPVGLLVTDEDGNVGASITERYVANSGWIIDANDHGDIEFRDGDGFVGWRFPSDGSEAQGAFPSPEIPPVIAEPPILTDGRGLHAWRAKLARIQAGVPAAVARLVLTGDSWTEHRNVMAVPLSQRLWSLYGESGTGWLGMLADESGEMSQLVGAARLVKAGTWTRRDMDPATSRGIDGYAFDTTDTTATITITDVRGDRIRWFYHDGAGAFSYSLDGAPPVAVTCGNTGAILTLDLPGLAGGDHDLTITHTATAGMMRHYGGYVTMAQAGVEFSKAGNGGTTGQGWSDISPVIGQIASVVAPELVVIILGTNDARLGRTPEIYEAGLRALIAAWRAASPTCGVVMILPPECSPAAGSPLYAQYHARLAAIRANTDDVEILSAHDFWPGYAVSNAQGLWTDGLHPNLSGGSALAALAMKLLKSE